MTIKTPNTNKFYVTMTDSFLSGWGLAKDKTAKIVIECNSYGEALVVLDNAKNRTEMKRATICKNKPKYNLDRYQVSHKTKEDCAVWFIKDNFSKQKKRGLL